MGRTKEYSFYSCRCKFGYWISSKWALVEEIDMYVEFLCSVDIKSLYIVHSGDQVDLIISGGVFYLKCVWDLSSMKLKFHESTFKQIR